MKVVDKEQERIQKEQTPAGKRKKLIQQIVLSILIAGIIVIIYLLNHHPAFAGSPHLVTLGGVTVEPGKTTVKELTDAGYEISDQSLSEWTEIDGTSAYVYHEVYDLASEVEGSSFYMLKLVKEGREHAGITIVNHKSSAAKLTECLVYSVEIHASSKGADTDTVDGIKINQLSLEGLQDLLGEPSDESSTGVYEWKKGKYSLRLKSGEKEQVLSVQSEREIN